MKFLKELQEQIETTSNVYDKTVDYINSDLTLQRTFRDLLDKYKNSSYDVPEYYNIHEFVNSIIGKIVPNTDEQLTYDVTSKLISKMRM